MNGLAMTEFLKNPWPALELALSEALSPGMALLDMGNRLREKPIGQNDKDVMAGLHKGAPAS